MEPCKNPVKEPPPEVPAACGSTVSSPSNGLARSAHSAYSAPPPSTPRSPRIFRVHGSRYHHDEILEAPDTHTDQRLADVAALGFDGVWICANLKWLAPTPLFEPYVDRVAQRLAALNTVIARAAKHGIGIWLYLNEPRSFPADHPFWQAHPECRGHHYDNNSWDVGWPWQFKRQPCYAMCVSAAPVVTFVREGIQTLLHGAPGTAGIITITNSEHPTHCYSKLPSSTPTNCPRCATRDRLDMPAAILTAMFEGIRASGSKTRLAAWAWAWHNLAPVPQPALLQSLPKDVALLVDFERGQWVEPAGIRFEVDEYSFAITGPTPRFQAYREAAGDREVWAKLQVGATHELATVPNIPAVATLYDKIAAVREHGVQGVMATWTMALRPTVNSFIAGRLLAHDGALPPRDQALRDLAMEYFDIDANAAGDVIAGWEQFSAAIRYFPTTVSFLYMSHVNYAPAFKWKLKREGTRMARSWTPEPWGDKLENTLGSLTMPQVATLLNEVATRWTQGLPTYHRGLANGNDHARQELSVAEACSLFYQSCAGSYQFAIAAESGAPSRELAPLIEREIDICRHAATLLEQDDRLGWHDDIGYMITPELIREKIAGLGTILEGLKV